MSSARRIKQKFTFRGKINSNPGDNVSDKDDDAFLTMPEPSRSLSLDPNAGERDKVISRQRPSLQNRSKRPQTDDVFELNEDDFSAAVENVQISPKTSDEKPQETLKIKDFTFLDLPEVPERDISALISVISQSSSCEDVIQRIFAEKSELKQQFYEKMATIGDCNLRLETPQILALKSKTSSFSSFLSQICLRPRHVCFKTVKGESINEYARQDSSVALLFNSLREKHPAEISVDKIGSYHVSIDQKSRMFQFRKFRRRSKNDEQKKIGHGAQAMLTAEPMFDEESNCVEICLELVRLQRKSEDHPDVKLEKLEEILQKAASDCSWSNFASMKIPDSKNGLFDIWNLPKYANFPILKMTNFIYEKERRHSDGQNFTKWVTSNFPRILATVRSSVIYLEREIDWSKFEDLKNIKEIKRHWTKIKELRDSQIRISDRYELRSSLRKLPDGPRKTKIAKLQSEFFLLILQKLDDFFAGNEKWRKNFSSVAVFNNWKSLFVAKSELKTRSETYQNNLEGLLRFWVALMRQSMDPSSTNLASGLKKGISKEIIAEIEALLTSGETPSPSQLTPQQPPTPAISEQIFSFPPIKEDRQIIIEALDIIYPNLLGILCEIFGEMYHVQPFGVVKDFYLFENENYLEHLLLSHQIQLRSDFSEANHLLGIQKFFLVQDIVSSTRLVSIMQYCDGGNLHDYIARLDGERTKQSSYLSFVFSRNMFDGLSYLRKNGLFHNDIKPENIFIHDTKALIGDFGLLSYERLDESGPILYRPKIRRQNVHPDFFALGLILIELFFEGGTIALHIIRHSKHCWHDRCKFILENPNFTRNPNKKLTSAIIALLRQSESLDQIQFFKTIEIIPRDKIELKNVPGIDLGRNKFVTNYVTELIHHIDRQMSSTTQNNEQKQSAVDYIQEIEDILTKNVNFRGENISLFVKKFIFANGLYQGVRKELQKNMKAEGSRVILPGKTNKVYNAVDLIDKWPMIFILQQLRNIDSHYYQCNDLAQREICSLADNNNGVDLSDAQRQDALLIIFREIFPFLDPHSNPGGGLLESSMPGLIKFLSKNEVHNALFAALTNSIIHTPGGDPLKSSDDNKAVFIIRLGNFLNTIRSRQPFSALDLERKMLLLDQNHIHKDWIARIKSEMSKFNPNFPENFKIKCKTTKILEKGKEVELHGTDSFLCMIDYFRNLLVHIPLPDRRGGAKADRKKEIAIATSIENFFYAHISRAGASAQKFKMSPSHLVAFIDFVFPSFFKIIVDVFRNESLFSANNSVFHPSSRIPFC